MEKKEGYWIIHNENGATLGMGPEQKEHIIEADGYAFKDLNRNGVLDPYEDWRLPIEERVKDLVSRMSIEEIAGLMLYSPHQFISRNDITKIYQGIESIDTREYIWELTDEQKKFLKDDNLRHVLVALIDEAPASARWNNNAQAFVEGLGLGIPIGISSDPRHASNVTAEFSMAGDDNSTWPEHLGLAATFNPEIVEEFGRIASMEYRAMGITTALSPQVDLGTEPRWNRFNGTFGESCELSTDMARAYCDGFQSSPADKEIEDGWGYDSVNAMVKHWPGGGTGEGGRDAHYGYGKYGVFPGNNLKEHLMPFTEGAFKLKGKTKKASSVMPYYTISFNQDSKNGENVGNSYSKYLITDLLRNKYDYDEVVCTDWGITEEPGPIDVFFGGKCWGVENLSISERHYKILEAGVDQFGGNDQIQPILEAYRLGIEEHGENYMRERFECSAKRLLRNMFRTGLFDNAYVDPEESKQIVGKHEFMQKGYEAQQKSVVLLKNKNNVLPLARSTKVYIPMRYIPEHKDWFGRMIPAHDVMPVSEEHINNFFELVKTPEEADCAFVFIDSPKSMGFKNGYQGISLQYRPYTAVAARKNAIAGENCGYCGKMTITDNEPDLDMILKTKKAMGNKPVIIFLSMVNPTVVKEFEDAIDVIVADFNVERKVLLEMVSDVFEPNGLLPFQMPRDMETVEQQREDVPFDMIPYMDECGNVYDFGYGLNWGGVINDWRTKKYQRS